MDAGVIIAIIAGVGGLISGVFVLIKGLGENRNQAYTSKAVLDKRIDDRVASELKLAYDEIDELRTKFKESERRHEQWEIAVSGVLSSLAYQWPSETPPVLNQVHVALLADTIPAKFRPRN